MEESFSAKWSPTWVHQNLLRMKEGDEFVSYVVLDINQRMVYLFNKILTCKYPTVVVHATKVTGNSSRGGFTIWRCGPACGCNSEGVRSCRLRIDGPWSPLTLMSSSFER